MTLRVDTAMVMAAGLGTRMRPLTDDRPKALVELAGQTLVGHALDRLAEDGVGKAVVNVHYFADDLEAHVRKRIMPSVAISDERPQLLETGGGLVKARDELGDAPILVLNIDSVWLEDEGGPLALETLRQAWDGTRMDALLLLAETGRSLGYDGAGDFTLDGEGRVARRGDAASAPYAYMGVQVFDPKLLEGRAVEPFSTNVIWNESLERGRLYGLALQGDWMHVGDPVALKAAEDKLAQRRA